MGFDIRKGNTDEPKDSGFCYRKYELQKDDEGSNDEMMKYIEQEIECPRCSDLMTLSSDFDRLRYICQECNLLLVMK
jgi:ribosomal protein S27AE